MLSLPETPISASGSVAISATSMVPMPAGRRGVRATRAQSADRRAHQFGGAGLSARCAAGTPGRHREIACGGCRERRSSRASALSAGPNLWRKPRCWRFASGATVPPVERKTCRDAGRRHLRFSPAELTMCIAGVIRIEKLRCAISRYRRFSSAARLTLPIALLR